MPPESFASPSEECDIIMKGGITSGVIYPRAICELAKKYRFRNIGGTSAGAIAAGLTAAAEVRRRVSPEGFEELSKLPDFLKENLLSLFPPTRSARPAFEILVATLGSSSKTRKALVFAAGAARNFAASFLAGTLAATLAAMLLGRWPATWPVRAAVLLVWGPLAISCGLAATAWALIRRTRRALEAEGFGLCSGMPPAGSKNLLALGPWLDQALAATSGLHGRPLVLRDLWEGRTDWKPEDPLPVQRQINLELMTTNITHGSPMRLPFGTEDYFFHPEELKKVLPGSIVDWMGAHPSEGSPGGLRDRVKRQSEYRPLPNPENLPVLFMIRMSLSFPGLLSAVSLHSVDWTLEANRSAAKEGRLERLDLCWFSDGGIGSNFPVHFFDEILPSRPTFGINLRPISRGAKRDTANEANNVDFPQEARDGVAPSWREIDGLFSFLGGIFGTMQNWVDNSQIRLPGYRDRVVHVTMDGEEGGLNLNMDAGVIERLSRRGQAAGQLLLTFDWDHHRWKRYLSALNQLQRRFEKMNATYTQGGFRAFLAAHLPNQPPYGRSKDWQDAALARIDGLMELAEAWAAMGKKGDFCQGPPKPEAELRVMPRL